MSARKIPLLIGHYYHIYNRGILKNSIFIDKEDKKRFIKLLFLCNGNEPVVFKSIQGRSLDKIEKKETIVNIGAYCLMPNHFHLLAKEQTENGISIFMKKLSTAYAMYFNTKYERSGILFEGRFKTKHIDTEAYLNWIFSYIHLNPIKLITPNWKEKGISDLILTKNFIEDYIYSSYYDYCIGNRIENIILNKNVFPEYFSQLNDFNKLVDNITTSKDRSWI